MDDVLRAADAAFIRYDAAKAAMRDAENELRGLCRRYDLVSGCRGIRVESLRIAVDNIVRRVFA